MGRALAALPAETREKMVVSTKATPGAINYPVSTESLNYDSVTTQLRTSVQELGRTVDIFYLHSVPAPEDNDCPLEETLRAVNDLHREGLFKRFGLSNFPAFGVMQTYYKCKELGYVLPTVYQGQYNPLTRQAEAEVFPCLRLLNMKFYSHGPLFAGVLATAGGRSAGVPPAEAALRAQGPPPTPMELIPDKPHDPTTGRHLEPAVRAPPLHARPCPAAPKAMTSNLNRCRYLVAVPQLN
jgi:aryl-alcohol dehydrogenase-like predicted oxidoreductase